MEEDLICPYPGLRPFNEDEAIFFKGRDEHIEQITRQLEEKKFLMLTGASGDGKSSLVYAGLIPNARAGFFKAKFNNWIVVDFRPERSPLKNLADALSDKFGAAEKERFQNELQFGFSALIDIYTQSPYYIDKNSPAFLALDEVEKKKALRKGANLMILVDQFEEFFTNTENYSNGQSSVDSQLVANLILETSKIALEKDIPIYSICTMRSDYIGQCASFRGLPEAIGFSQFFVPRLKRKEIYQVIQEPAQLNGNKISKRLVEVLISEMDEGIDQLPVLQHAMNQIWQIADKGKVEMDLIHFAMIGGIKSDLLTKEDKLKFETWFNDLPEYKKKFFTNPSLDNVLDAHANDLFYRAYDYLKIKHPAINLTETEAFEIIKVTFKCLTKIDQSRGVRNRMTLSEIVHIIAKPNVGEKEVAGILEIFRLQGNTFLKPFYNDGAKDNDLKSDSVLDITHESLIRNWSNLIEWAQEENADYMIWLDFEKQLKRWIADEKSNGYLLPIGALNFFETWIDKKNPNKYWLIKYDESDLPIETKLQEAEILLKDARQFIKRSANKLFVSRTILKYGADRIAYVFSTILVFIACLYLYMDYNSKKNSNVLAAAEEKGLEFLSSPKVKTSTKANFLLYYENAHPGTIVSNLELCGNDSVQIRTSLEIFLKLRGNTGIYTSTKETIDETTKIKTGIAEYLFNSIMTKYDEFHKDSTLDYGQASKLFWLAKTLDFGQFSITDSTSIKKLKKYNVEIVDFLYRNYIKSHIDRKLTLTNPALFNVITYYCIALGFDHDKLEYIVKNISPFESSESKEYFNISFQKNSNLSRDDFSLKYNGGFELMASLYAYLDDDEKVIRSIDSIFAYDNTFYTNRYNYGLRQIASSHWLGSKDSSHALILKLADKRIKTSSGNFEQWISWLSFESLTSGVWLSASELFLSKTTLHYNFLEYYSFKNCEEKVFDWYQKRIWAQDLTPDEVHFKQANIFKYRAQISLFQSDTSKGFHYMDKFKALVETMDPDFLNDSTTFGEGNQQIKTTRKAFLFYPQYTSVNNLWSFTNNWNGSITYIYEYYNRWGIFEKYEFNDNEIYSMIKSVYNDINQNIPTRYFNRYNTNRAKEIFNYCNIIKTKIIDKDKRKDFSMLADMMQTIDPELLYNDKSDRFLDSIKEKEYLNKEYYNCEERMQIAKLNVLKLYLFKLIRFGKMDKVIALLDVIENKVEKNNTLLDLCEQALIYEFNEEAIVLLKHYIKEFTSNKRPPALFYLLVSQIGGHHLIDFAMEQLKDADESLKPMFTKYMIRGMAQKREYQMAMDLIPSNISSNSELQFINEFLRAEFLVNTEYKIAIEKSWLSDIYLWTDRIYESANNSNCYCAEDE